MEGLAEERLLGAMGYLASAQLSWDLTADFVREREVFGKPLAAMQNTQFKMAELRAELDIAHVSLIRPHSPSMRAIFPPRMPQRPSSKHRSCNSGSPMRGCSSMGVPDSWMNTLSVANLPMQRSPRFMQVAPRS